MKLGVSSRLQILTNDVQVLILCLSYFITTVSVYMYSEDLILILWHISTKRFIASSADTVKN